MIKIHSFIHSFIHLVNCFFSYAEAFYFMKFAFQLLALLFGHAVSYSGSPFLLLHPVGHGYALSWWFQCFMFWSVIDTGIIHSSWVGIQFSKHHLLKIVSFLQLIYFCHICQTLDD